MTKSTTSNGRIGWQECTAIVPGKPLVVKQATFEQLDHPISFGHKNQVIGDTERQRRHVHIVVGIEATRVADELVPKARFRHVVHR
ncbi:MAG: hypothetical protein R2706_05935 [Acidimicrobiales bacterium]